MIDTTEVSHLTGSYWTGSRKAVSAWMRESFKTIAAPIYDFVCAKYPDYNNVRSRDCGRACLEIVGLILPLIVEADGGVHKTEELSGSLRDFVDGGLT